MAISIHGQWEAATTIFATFWSKIAYFLVHFQRAANNQDFGGMT
jgi:hypothetical protein